MLAQFVLMVFALFAVLSLVIDVGYARLTQTQMQTAADAAALEGLRKRDIGVLDPAIGQIVGDPFASDCLRRTAANRLVHWVFDDDFDPTNGDADYQFGAGPVVDLTENDAVSNLHAFATMAVPDSHVYKPDLQLNQQSAVYGDMVSGRFCYSADPAASEGLRHADPDTVVCTEPQHGSDLYARNDFNPNPAAPQPPVALGRCPSPDEPPPDPWPVGGSGSLTGVDDSAFLVRLRRSNELQDFGLQTEPDVASSGPSLPIVFGRGTTIYGDDPSSAYSPRRDGLTIRATAIAEVRPALHVGLPQTNPSLPGVATLANGTSFAVVDTFAGGTATQVTINSTNGVICSGVIPAANIANCTATAATAIGRFVANPLAVTTVGQALPAPVGVACGAANSAGFGPVYSAMVSAPGANRIIGFRRITFSPDPARPTDPCAKVITRGASRVAATNATAILSGELPLPITTPACEVSEILKKNRMANSDSNCPAFVTVNYAPVLAPVLAR